MPRWNTKRMFVIRRLSMRPYCKSWAMKTTTHTGKVQKFNRKVREETVKAI